VKVFKVDSFEERKRMIKGSEIQLSKVLSI
jgi:hypothetical protein